jgi:hypothetical protein
MFVMAGFMRFRVRFGPVHAVSTGESSAAKFVRDGGKCHRQSRKTPGKVKSGKDKALKTLRFFCFFRLRGTRIGFLLAASLVTFQT